MAWGVVAVAAGTALLGAYQASEQRRAQRDAVEQQNNANLKVSRAQTEYSPWTGIKPQGYSAQGVPVGQSDLGGAVQGGLGGAMFAMQAKNQMADNQAKQGAELEGEFNQMKADPLQANGMPAYNTQGNIPSWSMNRAVPFRRTLAR